MNFKLPNPLPEERQKELLSQYRESNNKEARELLVIHNLRLVKLFSNKYQRQDSPIRETDDLFQEGCIGLMNAIDTYNEDRGSFSGYAALLIKGAIFRYISNREKLIRIPEHKRAEILQLITVKSKLLHDLGREPTLREIAVEMQSTLEEVQDLLLISREVGSLDVLIGEDEDITLGGIIEDPSALFEDSVCSSIINHQVISLAKEALSYDQYVTLRMNMGLGCDSYDTREIAEILNKTPEEIIALKQQGLRILRRPKISKTLEKYIDESTPWVRSNRFENTKVDGGSNSSPVERLVVMREAMYEKMAKESKR